MTTDIQVRKTGLKSIILIVLLLVILLVGLSENWVLNYYSTGIYPIISIGIRFISSLFPWPIGDILYAALIIFALVKVFFFFIKIKRKQLTKQHQILIPLQLTNSVLLLFIAFKLLWGLNYSRPTIAQQLNISDEKYSVKQLVGLGNYFIDKLNALQPKIDANLSYNTKELQLKAVDSYKKMAEKNAFFTYTQPSFKPVINNWLISKMGIEGYYNPLSGEANINMNLPAWVLPFVACHEISHQIGVAKEDEANLVAYLVGINSDDINFRYSVQYNMLRYLLLEIRMKSPDDYLSMRERINPALLAYFKAENEFWRQYNGQMSNYMGVAFDKFLKLNRQKRGIKSYRDIVIWLWNYHKTEIR